MPRRPEIRGGSDGPAIPASPKGLRVATYNVHECVGTDGAYDPSRVARVLEEMRADVVGLQEVASQVEGGPERRQLAYLSSALGMRSIAGITLERRGGEYGNALLSRHEITRTELHDLSVPGFEPRGAVEAEIAAPCAILRVVVTHLGLHGAERRRQVPRLLQVLARRATPLTLLLADANEWVSLPRSVRRIDRILGRTPAPRSFPAWLPLLGLDRLWAAPRDALTDVRAHDTPLARRASDHLPVVGTLRMKGALCHRGD